MHLFSMNYLHHRIKLAILQNHLLLCDLPADFSDKSAKMGDIWLRLQDHFPKARPVSKNPLHERAAHSCDHKSVALSRFQSLKSVWKPGFYVCVQSILRNMFLRSGQRAFSYIHGNRTRNLSIQIKRNRQVSMIASHIHKSVSPGHQACYCRQT